MHTNTQPRLREKSSHCEPCSSLFWFAIHVTLRAGASDQPNIPNADWSAIVFVTWIKLPVFPLHVLFPVLRCFRKLMTFRSEPSVIYGFIIVTCVLLMQSTWLELWKFSCKTHQRFDSFFYCT